MKFAKKVTTGLIFGVAAFSPIMIGTSAFAATTIFVTCPQIVSVDEVSTDVDTNAASCDLSVDKQVSINGGSFVEADTAGDAASAHVGDTITWKITVTNNSSQGLTPQGSVVVKDVLPGGVTYGGSYTATAGTYTGNDGSFSANDWNLPLLTSDGDDGFVSSLPATLTITTTASAVGLQENDAVLTKYDNGHCDGGCVYNDADPSNDADSAFVLVQSPPQVLDASTTTPQVLADSTLVNTGSGIGASIIAGLLIIATLAIATYGRLYRRPKTYRLS